MTAFLFLIHTKVYQNTPPEMPFVCDFYQAKLIIRGMQRRSDIAEYHTPCAHPVLHILEIPDKKHDQLEKWRYLASKLKKPLDIQIISHKELEEKGFVMLARKNNYPDRKSTFEKLRDEYRNKDIRIIYSMWNGYLPGGSHPDPCIASFFDGIKPVKRHTSGHAYVSSIARVIETVDPKHIIVMHTECADEFSAIPAFEKYKDRILSAQDGQTISLDDL